MIIWFYILSAVWSVLFGVNVGEAIAHPTPVHIGWAAFSFVFFLLQAFITLGMIIIIEGRDR